MSRFNLGLLRGLKTPHLPAGRLHEPDDGFSRRSFINLSGAGFTLRSLAPAWGDQPFKLLREEGRAHFLVNGQKKWTIDPAEFGRAARLEIQQDEGKIELALSRAMFAGTEVPADFICCIEKTGTEWNLQLRTSCGMDLECELLGWLNGRHSAQGKWQISRLDPFPEFSVAFLRVPALQFTPDWVFHVAAPSKVQLRGVEGSLATSGLRIALAREVTLAGVSAPRSTAFLIQRGQEQWPIDLSGAGESSWQIVHDRGQSAFDELQIETAITDRGILRTALLSAKPAGSPVAEAALQFHPGGGLCDDCGNPFTIPLENPRLMLALEQKNTSALIADLAGEPAWAHGDAASFLFGITPDAPLFELHRDPSPFHPRRSSVAPVSAPGSVFPAMRRV